VIEQPAPKQGASGLRFRASNQLLVPKDAGPKSTEEQT
jgi:hypothetical protein